MKQSPYPRTLTAVLIITVLLTGCVPLDYQPVAAPAQTEATQIPALSATAVPIPAIATAVPTATPAPPSAEAILQAAFDEMKQAASYRFDMVMVMNLSGGDYGDGTRIDTHFAGDVLPPDRMQGTVNTTAGAVELEISVIVIGQANYFMHPIADHWQAGVEMATLFRPIDLVVEASNLEDLELLGEETVEGVAAYHLAGRARLPFSFEAPVGQVEADTMVDYWISQAGLQLVRSDVEGEVVNSAQDDGLITLSLTMRVFDYGAAIEIVAPEIPDAAVIEVPEVGPIAVEAALLAPLESETPEGHVQRGLAALAGGRQGLAIAHFNRALVLRPDWTDAMLYLGAALAIDGDRDTSLAYLERVIAAEPARADAHALRAWAHLRMLIREDEESNTAIAAARADIAQALKLDPALTITAGLKASADALEALNLEESEQDRAVTQFEEAMAGLAELLRHDPSAGADLYLTLLQLLVGLNLEDRDWLQQKVDDADAQLAEDPTSQAAYAVRGLMKMILGSQPVPDARVLGEASTDMLYAIALGHAHLPALVDPAGGPLQVARIWEAQEATFATGDLYAQVFFAQNPQLFPEFAHMLVSYCELQDVFIQYVDDPILFGIAFSPDGTQIATLSESGPSYLRVFDATTGAKLQDVELTIERIVATTAGNLAYSPDGRRIVAAYTNTIVRVVDAATGEVTLEIEHDKTVDSAAFSPDGKRIVTVDPDAGAPIVWDAETGERMLAIETSDPVTAAAFSPDGRQIAGGGEKVQVWDSETGELLLTLPGYAWHEANEPVFDAEGNFVGGGGEDVSTWDAETGEFSAPSGSASAFRYAGAPAFSPDGRWLAMPGSQVQVYDLAKQERLAVIPQGASMVAFSPDGARIAAAGYDVVGVWSAETGDLVFLAGHTGGADSVAWSPDGRVLVTGGPDGRFRVWDAESGAELWNRLAVTLWWEAATAGQE